MHGGGGSGHGDPLRLLSARSEFGYTDRAAQALPEEPEAVSREEQQRQTLESHRRAAQQRQEAVRAVVVSVNTALDALLAVCGHDRRVTSAARAVRRSTAALERQVRAS